MSRILASAAAVPALFGSILLVHGEAFAQRTQENVITSASDAFGTSIGNETIGLYRDNNVRGFSPTVAGNRRIEGMYFDLGGNGLTQRLTSRSVVRVGLPAQGYLFPAPSGIVDYTLRPSDDTLGGSVAVGSSEYGGYFLEADTRIPLVAGRLSTAVGGHYQRRYFEDGRNGEYGAIAVIPTLRFDGGQVTAFWSSASTDEDAGPLLITTGPRLPPMISGGRFYGQEWARGFQRSQTYGTLGRYELGSDLTFRFGLFESRSVRTRTYSDLFLDVQPDGSATNVMVAEPRLPARWTSGEARLSWTHDGTRFDHSLHVALRGRDKRLVIGGSATATLGRAIVGEFIRRDEPDFAFATPTVNSVRQWTAGLAYVGRWEGVMELNAGIQKTDYRSEISRPGNVAVNRDRPWLLNVALAVTPTPWLAFYGGYTEGLEETASPPASAVNRDDAVEASRTKQKEAGIRLAFGTTRLVAGIFEIERPYFSLDGNGIYGPLGTFRNRGVEVSLTAQPIEGLSVVGGLVLLDPAVVGEAVETGRAGPKAVRIANRTARLDLNYQTPVEGLSFDFSVQHTGRVAASTLGFAELGGRQLFEPGTTTFDIGTRYRFRAAETPMALRVLLANMFDDRSYEVRGSHSFFVRPGRRFSVQLSADF
ncbi:TonB-dependent receptor [Sphingosinicella sp. LHD-64]|uniref:TonB-dependent receptor n=1 Tax=Sphingosinicella sp. LHD-64 TaxID=3072139 RepID=UPI00280DCCA5|nr:TonB-dependent receptor [Sphingosinicella sp. LHD-64]MDQ8758296.1 TonB-dependent receptor [Sphingosinicella sp. LHD-64]